MSNFQDIESPTGAQEKTPRDPLARLDTTTLDLLGEVGLSHWRDKPIWAARGCPETHRADCGRPVRGQDGKPLSRRAPINPKTGGKALTNNPKTFATYAAAVDRQSSWDDERDRQPGVGMLLGKAHSGGLVRAALDLDGVETWPDGVLGEIVGRFASYTEASPSGEGVRVIFTITRETLDALDGKRRKWAAGEHVEIALKVSGFVTVTGAPGPEGSHRLGVRTVPMRDLEWLIEDRAPAWAVEMCDGNGTLDESGSGHAWRLATRLARDGLGAAEIAEAIAEDDAEAGEWWGRVDDRQRDRTTTRALAEVAKESADLAAVLDDLPPEDGAALADPRPAGGYAPDQDGAIRAFTALYGHRLRFDHDRGAWFEFDGNTWQPERTDLARDLARGVCMALAKKHEKAGKALRNVGAWEAVERGARAVRAFAVVSTGWDREPLTLGTPEGVVDLATGRARAGRPEEQISKRTAVHPAPTADCPQWLDFLDFALGGDAEAIRFLRMWAGISLTGLTREQKLLFIHGGGGNGKGVAVNTLAWVAGDYAADVPATTLTAKRHEDHPTELARLQGVRFAYASEVERGAKWAEQRIKSLTGGDPVTARFMRGDHFTFDPQLTLTVVGNDRPSFTAVDDAIRRRFLLLEMDRKPESPDPNLTEKLRAEGPGILRWMIEGALDWQRNGLIVPEAVRRATDDYMQEEDHFSRFLAECCDAAPSARTTTADLHDLYTEWKWGEPDAPTLSVRALAQEMVRRGYQRVEKISRADGTRGNGFAGILPHVESE